MLRGSRTRRVRWQIRSRSFRASRFFRFERSCVFGLSPAARVRSPSSRPSRPRLAERPPRTRDPAPPETEAVPARERLAGARHDRDSLTPPGSSPGGGRQWHALGLLLQRPRRSPRRIGHHAAARCESVLVATTNSRGAPGATTDLHDAAARPLRVITSQDDESQMRPRGRPERSPAGSPREPLDSPERRAPQPLVYDLEREGKYQLALDAVKRGVDQISRARNANFGKRSPRRQSVRDRSATRSGVSSVG